MKHHTAIEVALTTMHDLIEEARIHVRTALDHACRQKSGHAIGAIVPARQALEDALALQRAVIVIHELHRS